MFSRKPMHLFMQSVKRSPFYKIGLGFLVFICVFLLLIYNLVFIYLRFERFIKMSLLILLFKIKYIELMSKRTFYDNISYSSVNTPTTHMLTSPSHILLSLSIEYFKHINFWHTNLKN